jgi:hypothetical protein
MTDHADRFVEGNLIDDQSPGRRPPKDGYSSIGFVSQKWNCELRTAAENAATEQTAAESAKIGMRFGSAPSGIPLRCESCSRGIAYVQRNGIRNRG